MSNVDAPTRLHKVQHYLSSADFVGLGREVKQFIQWKLQNGWRLPVPLRMFQERVVLSQVSDLSQNHEYAILKKLVAHCSHRHLVDIGAHDGESWSNSRPFILEGWNGILVEPLPLPFQQLQSIYRGWNNVKTLCLAASDETGEATLFIGSDGEIGMGSTLCTDQNEWFDTQRSEQSITVKTDTLTNILSDSDRPQNFGLLLVDAEGMDYEVLLGLDFSLWRPEIIVSEEYPINRQKQIDKYSLLVNNDYLLYTVIEGINSVWLSSEFAQKLREEAQANSGVSSTEA